MAQANNPGPQQVNPDDTPARVRCLGGCGFWGDASTKNYCSVCFKKKFPDEAQQKAAAQSASASAPSNPPKKEPSNDSESKEDANDSNAVCPEVDDAPKKKVQKKKNRCWNCRKKMTLAGQFACKCGYTFCAKHRYPDTHDCDAMADHKKQHKANLAKNNQVVAFKKVEEI